MRVFLCSYCGFLLAIPVDYVSSVILYHGSPESAVDYNNESRNTYISIPLLLNLPQEEIKHGIILKNNTEDIDDADIIENRMILLTTAIQCETEIIDEEIFSMPKTLGVTQFSMFFNGLIFDSKNGNSVKNLILLINIPDLPQNIKKEEKHD